MGVLGRLRNDPGGGWKQPDETAGRSPTVPPLTTVRSKGGESRAEGRICANANCKSVTGLLGLGWAGNEVKLCSLTGGMGGHWGVLLGRAMIARGQQ